MEYTLEVLETIYPRVDKVTDTVYAIGSGNEYGVVNTAFDKVVAPQYTKATYRPNYTYFRYSNENMDGLLVFNSTGIEYKVNNRADMRSTALIDYDKLIDISVPDGDEYTRKLIHSETGELLLKYSSYDDVSYRPADFIMYSVIDGRTKQVWCVTSDMRVMKLEDALAEKYTSIKETRGSKGFKCKGENGEEVNLNKYGQRY